MFQAKRFWAWLSGGKLVWLQDSDGEATLRIARLTAFGDLIAKRKSYLVVRLLDDGTVEGKIGNYVKKWKAASE